MERASIIDVIWYWCAISDFIQDRNPTPAIIRTVESRLLNIIPISSDKNGDTLGKNRFVVIISVARDGSLRRPTHDGPMRAPVSGLPAVIIQIVSNLFLFTILYLNISRLIRVRNLIAGITKRLADQKLFTRPLQNQLL